MKLSETWLREWVNPNLKLNDLATLLTMSGLEVEEVQPVAENFEGVVIGEVVECKKHPHADHLSVCQVKINKKDVLQIVCGAPNVFKGLKAPVALINAVLPNDKRVTKSTIREVSSHGMLCSAAELGLGDEADRLLELGAEAKVGETLWQHFILGDFVLDVSITPNRGDCLSVRGLAREISALAKAQLREHPILVTKSKIKDVLPVQIQKPKSCPRYVGRVIRNVKADVPTPLWLKERLRRSGIRSISPIVDVGNYVMMELGQPMAVFDLDKIDGGIVVRHSKKGERIKLLDGTEQTLDDQTLMIADKKHHLLAIAGVMGDMDSSVTSLTQNVFLESAFFSPQVIARNRQTYQLNSESAYRFERGVDPTIQREAIERVTQLILEIVGGEPGPIIEKKSTADLPKNAKINLEKKKVDQVLGLEVAPKLIDQIFKRLRFDYKKRGVNAWQVTTPPYRFDMSLPEDLIEEIARFHGYDKIPTTPLKSTLKAQQIIGNQESEATIRQILSDQDYHEIITYSFIDKQLLALLEPQRHAFELLNPISSEMAVMRTSLWPGLVSTLLYNKSRQQQRVRLFEIGTCFDLMGERIHEETHLGALIYGTTYAEQWGVKATEVDFFDLKGDVEAICASILPGKKIQFKEAQHPALNPNQTAVILVENKPMGLLGALHPRIMEALKIAGKVFVFELNLTELPKPEYHYKPISKFPEIRRDIALLINEAIPAKAIQDTIRMVVGDWLQDVFIFDVYQGKGIPAGLKSVALALILQHPMRTLVDDEVAALMERVIIALKGQLGAELRS